MTEKRQRPVQALFSWIAVCVVAGIVGSIVTTPKIPTWYASLAKPTWNPPDWVFGPVWTALYVLMGVAAWMVWMAWARRASYAGGTAARSGLLWFGVQLALNVLWSFLFFGLERPDAAFAEIVVLWTAITTTLVLFRRVKPVAAWLLVPYLAWVTFAAYLNFTIWRLNA